MSVLPKEETKQKRGLDEILINAINTHTTDDWL